MLRKVMIDADFFEDRGLVWVTLGSSRPGWYEAMNDSISSLSPRGQSPELSTYWIDHALTRVNSPPGTRITGRNSTRIERTATGVVAKSDYEMFEDEHMSVDDFDSLLRAWRDRVVALQRVRDPARPEHAPYNGIHRLSERQAAAGRGRSSAHEVVAHWRDGYGH